MGGNRTLAKEVKVPAALAGDWWARPQDFIDTCLLRAGQQAHTPPPRARTPGRGELSRSLLVKCTDDALARRIADRFPLAARGNQHRRGASFLPASNPLDL